MARRSLIVLLPRHHRRDYGCRRKGIHRLQTLQRTILTSGLKIKEIEEEMARSRSFSLPHQAILTNRSDNPQRKKTRCIRFRSVHNNRLQSKSQATEYHLGLLKAKLARYRAQLLEPVGKSSGGGTGFDVQKSGDARVALIGFPSVGKARTQVIRFSHLVHLGLNLLEYPPEQMHAHGIRGCRVRVHDSYGPLPQGRVGTHETDTPVVGHTRRSRI